MKFEVLNQEGQPINVILASLQFMQANYPNGNYREVVPEPTSAPIPASVTPRQARIALALTPATDSAFPHLLAQIEAAFADLPEPDKTVAEITWEYSIEIQRSNQLITQMQGMLALTDEQIDQLFIAASQIAP